MGETSRRLVAPPPAPRWYLILDVYSRKIVGFEVKPTARITRWICCGERPMGRARLTGSIVGFMALVGNDVDQLYVLPGYYRRGVGRKLLDLAKARSPSRLLLYTFQRNRRARAFYESQGFRIIDMTDGLRNEEKEPDIRYEWTPVATPGAPKLPPGQE